MTEKTKAVKKMQDYIIRSKLSASAMKLHDEKCKILDAALDIGFGSVDGYQRVFCVNAAVIGGDKRDTLFLFYFSLIAREI